jgi:hypothetical protein
VIVLGIQRARHEDRLVCEPRSDDATFDLLHCEHVDIEVGDRLGQSSIRSEPVPRSAVAHVPRGDPHPALRR